MSKKTVEKEDVELSKLLDRALNDFDRLKNTDDELDEMMVEMDDKAVRKSAEEFDAIIERLKANMRNYSSEIGEKPGEHSNVTKGTEDKGDAESKTAQQLMNLLKPSSFGLEDEGGSSDQTLTTLEQVISALLDKSFLAPPINELLEKYTKYLADNNDKLSDEVRKRYEMQIAVLKQISAEYAKPDPITDEEKHSQFETIKNLFMELQEHGFLPEELMDEMPQGWTLDSDSGLPQISDMSRAADSCSLM